VLYCCLSLTCLLIAVSSTYGLGGFLRFQKDAQRRRRRRAAALAAALQQQDGLAPSSSLHQRQDRLPPSSPRLRALRQEDRCGSSLSCGSSSSGEGSGDGGLFKGGGGSPEPGAAAAGSVEGDGEGGGGAEWQFFQPFSGGSAFVAAQVRRGGGRDGGADAPCP
jgi:hypothetical protein